MAVLKLEVIMAAVDRITRPLGSVMDRSRATSTQVKALRDKLKELNSQAGQIDAFRKLQSQTAVVGRNMGEAQAKVKRLADQLAATDAPTRAMTRALADAKREANQLTTQHDQMTQRLQRQRDALNAAGLSTNQLGSHQRRLRSEVAGVTSALEAEQRRLEAINQRAAQLRAAQEQAARTRETAGNLAGAGAKSVASGAAMGYGLTRFMGAGVEFGTQMSKVQALARLDKDSAQMQALRDQAKQLGASTSFSGGNVASGQAFLAMAGFTPEAVRAAMPGLLDMSKAGDIDLGRGADISSNILSGMGIAPDQMGKVADVLTRTFTGSNTTLDMLGQTMAYAAPVAKIYGQNLEVVSAMAGKLGDAGVQGSMAGTAIAAIMNRLAAPPKMAADAIEQLGLKTKDAAGNMRPMPDILKEIFDKTQGMGNAERGGLLKAIAGEEAVKGLATLVDQAGSGELQKFVATLENAKGTAAKTAGVMADNLSGDITNAKSAFESIQIAFAEANDGWQRASVQWITNMTRAVGQWATENPRLVQTITMLAAGLAGVLVVGGSLAMVVAGVLVPMALAKLAMVSLGMSSFTLTGMLGTAAGMLGKVMGAIKWVGMALLWVARLAMAHPLLALVTAIAAAAMYIWSNWDTLGPRFKALWDGIKAAGGAAWDWVVQKATGAGRMLMDFFLNWTLPGLIIKHWDGIKAAGGAAWDWVVQKATGAGRMLMDFFLNWALPGLIIKHWDGIIGFMSGLPARFATIGGQVIDGLMAGLSARWEATKAWFAGLGSKIAQATRDALGIKSPSRVFAVIGQHVMQGLGVGLDQGEGGPLDLVRRTAGKLAGIGAAMGIGLGAAGGAAASTAPFAIDTRPPLSPSAASAPRGSQAAPIINITINAAPGMDERALARLVATEIERHQRQAQSAQRSRLTDAD